MNFLSMKRNFTKDISQIQLLSLKIEKKLAASTTPDIKIDTLTSEELQDVNKIVGLANYMLSKYEDKKETRVILQRFISIITESAQSIESIDDEISELIFSAEDSINKVKNLHSKIFEKSDLKESIPAEFTGEKSETSSINLTNFTTPVNTIEYQQNSPESIVQVI